MFLLSYRNTGESLGEREMLWEHVFPQLFRVLPNFHETLFLQLNRNTEYMFSISFRKHRDERKENNLLTLIVKM